MRKNEKMVLLQFTSGFSVTVVCACCYEKPKRILMINYIKLLSYEKRGPEITQLSTKKERQLIDEKAAYQCKKEDNMWATMGSQRRRRRSR